jgi:rhodanese-related sulfurtransferase
VIPPVLRQAFIILALALLPAAGHALYMRDRVSWDKPSAADEVTVSQASEWGQRPMWIDARAAADFAAAHIPGALPLSADSWDKELPQVLNQWTPDRKIVVYCSRQSCDASREIARRLKDEAGLKNVAVLQGGWEAWQEHQR